VDARFLVLAGPAGDSSPGEAHHAGGWVPLELGHRLGRQPRSRARTTHSPQGSTTRLGSAIQLGPPAPLLGGRSPGSRRSV
jgi:hypothetical protein